VNRLRVLVDLDLQLFKLVRKLRLAVSALDVIHTYGLRVKNIQVNPETIVNTPVPTKRSTASFVASASRWNALRVSAPAAKPAA